MKSFMIITLWFTLHIAFLVWGVPNLGTWWGKTINGFVALSAFYTLYDIAAHVWYGGDRKLILQASPFWSIPVIALIKRLEETR